MKRTLTTAVLCLILLTGYALWSQTRCGWYEGRMLPCPRARIASGSGFVWNTIMRNG